MLFKSQLPSSRDAAYLCCSWQHAFLCFSVHGMKLHVLQAGTPGCTKQACKFRDEYGKFVDKEVEVFGISSDTPEKNAEFAQQQRLPFPLLTDQSDFLRKSFGIKGDLFGMLKGRQVCIFLQHCLECTSL